ncbi:MAG: ACT domain-containing protein [Planctomycetota bacterium]
METNSAATLAEALAAMRFRVLPGFYCLISAPPSELSLLTKSFAPFAASGGVVQIVIEKMGVTAVAPEPALRSLHSLAGYRIEHNYRVIQFETPMTWDVVGFLALVTRKLAEAGVPLGAICSFDRDYLFIRETHLEQARAALIAGVCPETV